MILGDSQQRCQSQTKECWDKSDDLPDNATNHDGRLPTEDIRQRTGDERTGPGASGHGGRDAALDQRLGPAALVAVVKGGTLGALVEVALVALHAQLGRQRRNVETEEGTADDRDAGDDIDVADGHGC